MRCSVLHRIAVLKSITGLAFNFTTKRCVIGSIFLLILGKFSKQWVFPLRTSGRRLVWANTVHKLYHHSLSTNKHWPYATINFIWIQIFHQFWNTLYTIYKLNTVVQYIGIYLIHLSIMKDMSHNETEKVLKTRLKYNTNETCSLKFSHSRRHVVPNISYFS